VLLGNLILIFKAQHCLTDHWIQQEITDVLINRQDDCSTKIEGPDAGKRSHPVYQSSQKVIFLT